MLSIILMIVGLFSYTILEFILKKGVLLKGSKKLWNSLWIFLWGVILLILIFFIKLGEYEPWGDIMNMTKAAKHILMWIVSILIYYFFNNNVLNGSAAALSWKKPEFYYFCFVIPIFEEVLFRGIILINLLNKYPTIKYEEFFVMLSSLLFSLFHLNYSKGLKFDKNHILSLFFIFIWGNAIGYLVLLTGSLWMSIYMHVLLNTVGSIYYNVIKKNDYSQSKRY